MKDNIKTGLKTIIGPAIVLLIWHLAAKGIDNRMVLPTISSVIKHFIEPADNLIGLGSLLSNVLVSLARVVIGYTIALLIGLPLGIFMGYKKTVDQVVTPVISLFRPIPPIAWVPLVLAWFGVSSLATLFGLQQGQTYIVLHSFKISMIFIIFLGAFYPITLGAMHGISKVPKTLIESARVLGASESDIFFKILLPGAASTILYGMRTGLGSAWTSLVSAEMLPGSLSGLGYLITHAYELAKIDIVVAGMISIGIIGSLLDFSIRFIDKKTIVWEDSNRSS